MEITLDAIDQVRARTGVSYRRAHAALVAAGGDVVAAIRAIEAEGGGWRGELRRQLRTLVREGNATRIVVRHGGRTVLDLPATVGVLGAALAPVATAAGVVAALAARATISVER
jgi:hypothetical protein